MKIGINERYAEDGKPDYIAILDASEFGKRFPAISGIMSRPDVRKITVQGDTYVTVFEKDEESDEDNQP